MEAAPRPQSFTLCADDYAIAPATSAAIRDLIADGRLSATSCMTLSPHWPGEAAALRALRDKADIGLHFTLTAFEPLGPMPSTAPAGAFPSLATLARRAMLRRLDRAEIAAELGRQLDRFEAAFDAPPDFIDGHHHVHQLPLVRDAVLDAFRRRLDGNRAWLRICAEPAAAILRRGVARAEALAVSAMGHGLRRQARQAGIPANRSFRGVRSFAEPAFDALFARWLDGLVPGTLIMCHPGLPDAALAAVDSVVEQRRQEYDFLRGPQFIKMLAARGASLARLSR
jgi:chitin disaccharide deacetylase